MNCPGCNREFYIPAAWCPHCAHDFTLGHQPVAQNRGSWAFSLRSLCGIITFGALLLGYLANGAHGQEAAVRTVQSLGGQVWYDFQFDTSGHLIHGAASPLPRSWPTLIRDDLLFSVLDVRIDGGPVTSAQWALLKGLPKLERLYLAHASDRDLRHIAHFRRLEWLGLNNTAVTDEGIEGLENLDELWELGLSGTRITDSGLATVGKLRELKHLGLSNTAVSDEGLKHLQQLDQLRTLSLSGTCVSDDGLRYLTSNRGMEVLDVRNTSVTREGVRQFKRECAACHVEYD